MLTNVKAGIIISIAFIIFSVQRPTLGQVEPWHLTYSHQVGRGTADIVSCNPVNNLIAIAGNSNQVRIYNENLVDIHILYLSDTAKDVFSLSWSPDGTLLAVGTVNTTTAYSFDTEIWNIDISQDSFERVGILPTQFTLTSGQIDGIKWNPNPTGSTSQLATVNEKTFELEIWDISAMSLQKIQHWQLTTDPVFSIAWNPNGTQIASSHIDNLIMIWNVADEVLITTLDGSGSYRALEWSPSGAWLAGYNGSNIIIWEPDVSSPAKVLQGHTGEIYQLAWSVDDLLASSAEDSTVHIWDVNQEIALVTFSGFTTVTTIDISWNPDGAYLITTESNAVRRWSIVSRQQIAISEEYSLQVRAFSADPMNSEIITVPSLDEGNITLWETNTGRFLRHIQTENIQVIDTAWSFDGGLIAVSTPYKITLLDGVDKTITGEIPEVGGYLAWSPNSQYVAASWNGITKIVSIPQTEIVAEFDGTVDNSAWRSDDELVGIRPIGFNQYEAVIWNIINKTEVTPLSTNESITSAIWAGNGSWLVTGTKSGRIQVWDAQAFQLIHDLIAGGGSIDNLDTYQTSEFVLSTSPTANTSFSPYKIHVWDIQVGLEVGYIDTESVAVYDVAWLDSDTIAFVNDSGIVEVWKNIQIPSPPILVSPVGTISENNPSFIWTDVLQATEFTLRVKDSSGVIVEEVFNRSVCFDNVCDTGSQTTLGDGEYLWEVQSSNTMGTSTWSEPLDFTIETCINDSETLINSINDANASGIPTTLCLSQDSIQTFDTPDNGLSALPIITGDITIEGNGATLTRDETADLFRFFEVAPGGSR